MSVKYLAYYLADGRYGSFTDEVFPYVNCYYAWARRGYERTSADPNSVWLPRMAECVARAAAAGKSLYLNLNMQESGVRNTPVKQVLEIMRPYWDQVIAIELADEPKWDWLGTRAAVRGLNAKLDNMGLAPKKFGIVYYYDQVMEADPHIWNLLDFVGIEAYVDPPGPQTVEKADRQVRARLNNQLDRVLGAGKQAVVVMQAYARNGAWTDMTTLKALQYPAYDVANGRKGVFALTMFSCGRESGTMDLKARGLVDLTVEHKAIAQQMGIV